MPAFRTGLFSRKAAERRGESEALIAESARTGAVCEICNGIGRKATEHRARHHILAAQDAFGAPQPLAKGGQSENPSDLQANSAAETKGSWKSEQLCNLFRQGDCKYGDRCRFVHDEGQAKKKEQTLLLQDFHDHSEAEDVYVCSSSCSGHGVVDQGQLQRRPAKVCSAVNSVPEDLIREIASAPKAGFNNQTRLHAGSKAYVTLLDGGATGSSIPEEILEDIIDRTAAKVKEGQFGWKSKDCPIVILDKFCSGPKHIHGSARNQPIEVPHAVVLRVMFVPIGSSYSPIRKLRFQILPRGSSSFLGLILAAPCLVPAPLGLGFKTEHDAHVLEALGVCLPRLDKEAGAKFDKHDVVQFAFEMDAASPSPPSFAPDAIPTGPGKRFCLTRLAEESIFRPDAVMGRGKGRVAPAVALEQNQEVRVLRALLLERQALRTTKTEKKALTQRSVYRH